ncbi:unannotated protein [freshwater metagenome]|uniref:Unannotated protein n=1 Tax=freshwater metagenome TaxID=449393 RepID=A0A6J7IZF8_9ZZZZ
MTDEQQQCDGLRERLTRSGEEALGRIAQDLLENPVVIGTITRAFAARERATQAQEVAMSALNLPSAADLERLTRRLRSVGQRLEGIEESLDRLEERIQRSSGGAVSERLDALAAQLANLEKSLTKRPAAKRPAAKKPAARAAKPAAPATPSAEPPTAA